MSARLCIRPSSGFTLLELLVVVSLIAIASAGVALALRDSAHTSLERESQRLAALLESGRAQSRARGVAVVWRATATGFWFEGLPPGTLPQVWLDSATRVVGTAALELGPEPMMGPQSVTLSSGASDPGLLLQVATDGLRPYGVRAASAPTQP